MGSGTELWGGGGGGGSNLNFFFSGGGEGRDLVENNRLLHQVEAGASKERGFFLK